ncbi:MAG: polysaccharide deacetylase family protein [Deltaproteobacteria bacterium]|nr:polysaccharide deacetylase family protein [Deltaproteobacteria bacterium]
MHNAAARKKPCAPGLTAKPACGLCEGGSLARRAKLPYDIPMRFLLCLCLLCLLPASAAQAASAGAHGLLDALWTPAELAGRQEDHARTRGNDTPLTRPEPRAQLPPLPPGEEGNIRRVAPPRGDKPVALTFDLCELAARSSGYDDKIIGYLRARAIPATFFAGGKWLHSHRERGLQLMADPLFELGNHAWTHGNFGILDAPAMREQILRTQAYYEDMREELLARARQKGLDAEKLVAPAMRFFRLPYGRCSPEALRLLHSLGLRVIQWDVGAENAGDNSLPGMAQRVADRVRPGSILLFHANGAPKGSAALLAGLVPLLQKRGFRFVRIGELLEIGRAQLFQECYFERPGDNLRYDAMPGAGGSPVRRQGRLHFGGI